MASVALLPAGLALQGVGVVLWLRKSGVCVGEGGLLEVERLDDLFPAQLSRQGEVRYGPGPPAQAREKVQVRRQRRVVA